jgi:folate-binding protein YgfZ
MNAAQQAAAVRCGAGLFRLADRSLVAVEGSDRVRWLDGMVSNDVSSLEPGPERSGCYATLLTRKGRIVADLHVLLRGEAFWLELAAQALAPGIAALERFIVADDVRLRDASGEVERLGLEGPAAPAILEAALGAPLPLAPEACTEVELAGRRVVAAAFGWSGAPARQLFAPAGAGPPLAAALLRAGAPRGLVEAGPAALEILRIEAGIPRLGAELDEDVLPAEAGLERAISRTKGCYTGQEVVARLESRGHVKHRLVGFRLDGETLPPPGAEVVLEGRSIGEVTSACLSPAAGAIALGYVQAGLG